MATALRVRRVLLGFVIILAAAAGSFAQVRLTGADLEGRVLDPSGARVPGATLVVRNLSTNVARETTTDAEGRYRAPALDPGEYEIRASLPGFVTGVRERVRLQLGELVEVGFQLQLAAIEQSVVVTAPTPAVSPEQTSVSTIITEQQIARLPANGRRFIELAALAAGVTSGGPPDPGAEASGLSVLGQRPLSNSLLIDGLDNNDRMVGGASGAFSQESIREFQVLTGSYPAEFGNATGGVVNIVTRSGANTVTGSAFAYNRDDRLNARNHFERVDPFGAALTQPEAPFSQWQVGGAGGGPWRRDRTFLFSAAERRDATASNFVTIDATAASVLTRAGFPVERGHVAFEDTANQVMVRLDHYWKPERALTLRLQWSDAVNGNYAPFGGLVARSAGARATRSDWGVAASQTHVIGRRWVNEARLQIARHGHVAEPYDPAGPRVTIIGLGTAGRGDFFPTDRSSGLVQAKDTVTLATARHTIKAGVDVTTIGQEALVSYNFGGSYTFVALPAIPGVLPVPLSSLQAFAAGLPAVYVQGYGDGSSPFKYTQTSAFVQDDWRATSRLTFKVGLRYQRQWFPDFDVTVTSLGGTPLVYPYPLGDHHLSPRVGVAIDPAGDGRTSVHAAYGLFFGDQLTGVYSATNVFGRQSGTRLHVYPFPLSLAAWQQAGHRLPDGAIPAPRVTITVGPDARTPRVHQASAGVTRDLGRGTVLGVEAVYARGFHQLGALDYNPIVPALGPGRRPNDIGGMAGTSATAVHYTDYGETWYRGLLMSLQQRLGTGHDIRLAYTWSSAEDNSSSALGLVNDNGRGRDPQHPTGLPAGFDATRETGPAATDEGHRLVVNGSSRLPGRLELAALLSAASGLPFTALAGADLNGDGIADADRARTNPVDASTTVARNGERFVPRITLDLRLARPFHVGSRATLTTAIDVFNVFNRANFNDVNNVFGTGAFPDQPQRDVEGRVTYGRYQKALAPRQVQLAVRVAF